MKGPRYSIVAAAIIFGIIVGTSAGFTSGLLLVEGLSSDQPSRQSQRDASNGSSEPTTHLGSESRSVLGGSNLRSESVRVQPLANQAVDSTTVQVSRSIPADISVTADILPFCVFDTDESGFIERSEAVEHITKWLLGLDGPRGQMTRDDAVQIVTAYLLQLPIICDE